MPSTSEISPSSINSRTFLPTPVFSTIVPPTMASNSPTATYDIAIGKLNTLINRINAPKSTSGLEIRKLKVTPLDIPALVKPIKIGIEEHEQNGVTVPSSAPTAFAPMP